MKENIKLVMFKYLTGYLVNSVLVLFMCVVLHLRFNIDVFDALLLSSIFFVLMAFFSMKSNSIITPAISPLSGDGNKDVGVMNAVAESLLVGGNGSEQGEPVRKATIKFYILQRSTIELLSYSVIIIAIGLIKYYSYF